MSTFDTGTTHTHTFSTYHTGTPHQGISAELYSRNGQTVRIVRELGDDERDAEVGRMFAIAFPDGFEAHAFEDEITPGGWQ